MNKTDSESFKANLTREWYIGLGSGFFLLIILLFFYDQPLRASGIMVGGFLTLNFLILLGKTRVTSIQVISNGQISICVTKNFISHTCYSYDLKLVRWKSKKRVSFRGLRFKQISLLCDEHIWKIQSNRLGWKESEVDRLEMFLNLNVENVQ
jgi:hypothetical protein